MAAARALFDTSVIVPWLTDDPRFKPHIKKVLGDLRKKKAVKYLSVVTVQELEVGARYSGEDALEKLRTFLSNEFAPPLVLDHAIAKRAAQLAAATPRRAGSGSAEKRQITNTWHRDASIAATAEHHALNFIVTADSKDFVPFMEHLEYCRLMIVNVD